MANFNISIFDNFLSGGNVGNNFLNSENATLNASTRIRSRVACAVRYFCVARRRRRRSSRDSPTKSDGCKLFNVVDMVGARRRGVFGWRVGNISHGRPKYESRHIVVVFSCGAR